MPRTGTFFRGLLCLVTVWLTGAVSLPVASAISHDRLLPDTTKVYVHATDVGQLQERWKSTQFWKLYRDESMKVFRTEWQRYFADNARGFQDQTGLTMDELGDVIQGEASIALVATGKYQLSNVMLADVSDVHEAAGAMLAKAGRRLQEKGARRESRDIRGAAATVFHRTGKDKSPQQMIYLIHEGTLCIATDVQVIDGILARWSGEKSACLAEVEAYRETQAICDEQPHSQNPDARWFVDLMSYVSIINPPDPNGLEDRNVGESLSEHGADAVRGIGGTVTLAHESRDLIMRLMIHAPLPHKGAMAMFRLPTADDFAPHRWLSDDVNMITTIYWDLFKIIDNIGALFDSMLGDGIEGTFSNLLEDFKAADGPGVDLREDLIAHLGSRMTVLNNSISPVSPDSERSLIAVETRDEMKVALALKKMLRDDPGVRRLRVTGYPNDLWQIGEDSDLYADNEEGPRLTSSAAMVANGHLLLATHTDLLRSLLRHSTGETLLADAGDLKRLDAVLEDYIPGPGVGRIYSRAQRDFETSYELLRQDKADQMQSIYGMLMSGVLAGLRNDETGELEIDFSTLAQFGLIREYLGMIGIVGKNHDKGWYVVIVALPPE